MKKRFTLITLLVSLSLFAQPQLPLKMFDVRNGNGVVDSGTTYPNATVIVYGAVGGKTAAQSKQAVIDAFATAYNYQATVPDPNNPGQTIPNPQSKQAFFNKTIQDYIRGIYKAEQAKAAEMAAGATARDAADAELPPQ